MTRGALPAAAAVLALSLASCAAPSALSADDGLRITTPAPMSLVPAKFVVRWDADDKVGKRFAVFVDQAPLAKGANLSDLADQRCRDSPPCPDATYFKRKGVYLADQPETTIGPLPKLAGMGAKTPHPVRTLTIIAVDDAGRRISDSAWKVEVRV